MAGERTALALRVAVVGATVVAAFFDAGLRLLGAAGARAATGWGAALGDSPATLARSGVGVGAVGLWALDVWLSLAATAAAGPEAAAAARGAALLLGFLLALPLSKNAPAATAVAVRAATSSRRGVRLRGASRRSSSEIAAATGGATGAGGGVKGPGKPEAALRV